MQWCDGGGGLEHQLLLNSIEQFYSKYKWKPNTFRLFGTHTSRQRSDGSPTRLVSFRKRINTLDEFARTSKSRIFHNTFPPQHFLLVSTYIVDMNEMLQTTDTDQIDQME